MSKREKNLMKALNLDNQKYGCYVNINGRNQLWGERIFLFISIHVHDN